MSVISVRLNSEEENLLKEVAKFEGIGISSYIKKIIFERLEEEYDLKLVEKAYQSHLDSKEKTHTFDFVAKELGIKI